MRRDARILVILAGAILVSGCATFGTMQTASTVGRGHTRVALEPSMWGAGTPTGSAFVPVITLSAEYGVSDQVDIGGRVGTPGFELWGKFQLTPPLSRLVVSLAPSAGGFALIGGTGGGGVLFFQLPVLVGFKIGGSELVIGPKLHDWMLLAGSGTSTGSGNLFSVGGTVGFALRLGSGFRIMPEIAILRPVVASVTAGTGDSTLTQVFDQQAYLMQFSISLMFGG